MKKHFLFLLSLQLAALTLFSQYKYLGTYTSDGLPNYLAQSDQVSAATLSMIQNALPENYPVPTYNPQYISSGYDTDIRLTDSAEVWVTFVDEGAGYKNVLGFYTYDTRYPLTAVPSISNITIIFPNVSKLNSGGSLVAGNKVKLGSFPAYTGIGFMLIADGWRSGAVTSGNWRLFSNPSFNPETNPSLKFHNVLISDSVNQRIILGFEDIRRDNSGCDNDFNDALFYVTASPYTAIEVGNYAPIESANTAIQSANLGGLESNGRLAQKIAARNFGRDKDPLLKRDKIAVQLPVLSQNVSTGTSVATMGVSGIPSGNNTTFGITRLPLSSYFPSSGMLGIELPYTSTPSDLLKITNAEEIYSVDYYNGVDRVSAGLGTYTSKRIYDHSKSICDRLNGSSLEDVRTILLKGHKLINITFKKADGETEYAISFSVQLQPNQYRLYSYWNIDQYPAGEYLNFQAWGKSMGQVCNVINDILTKLESQMPVISDPASTVVPLVYVKKGHYSNGSLFLTIVNKAKTDRVLLKGNATPSETLGFQPFATDILINGEKEKTIEITNTPLFDIGLSLTYTGATVNDALYLADGAWGSDYVAQDAANVILKVQKTIGKLDTQQLNIEREPSLSGKIKGTVNLFRNAKAGNTAQDISGYTNLTLELLTDKPVEIVLVSKDLLSWNQRARYTVAPSSGFRTLNIPLSNFRDSAGKSVPFSSIKSLVFTVRGNYNNYTDFTLSLKNISFNNNIVTDLFSGNDVLIFPNPVEKTAVITVPSTVTKGKMQVIDIAGRTLKIVSFNSPNNKFIFERNELKQGLYFVKITAENDTFYTSKMIIQ